MSTQMKFEPNPPPKKKKYKRPKGVAPRRPGRPSILDGALSLEDILKVFELGLPATVSAKKLGISTWTYRKILRDKGYYQPYKPVPAGPGVEHLNGHSPSLLLEWCRAHPKRNLPRSIRKIAKMTGIKYETIKQYLKKRKRRVKDWIVSLGDLRALKGTVITDSLRRKIPVDLVTLYTISLDNYDLDVLLDMVLKGGVRLKARLGWKEYVGLFGKVPGDAPWVPRKRVLVKNPSLSVPLPPSSGTHPDHDPETPVPSPQ